MRRGRQSGRRRLACTTLPVLRRPDDRRRDVRRAAPLAFPAAGPDQDRQLMTVAPHAPAHRRSPSPPPHAPEHERDARARSPVLLRPTRTSRSRASSPSKTAAAAASAETADRRRPPTPRSEAVRDPQIPIGALDKRSPTSPRFPPWEAFGRRPRRTSNRRKGRRFRSFGERSLSARLPRQRLSGRSLESLTQKSCGSNPTLGAPPLPHARKGVNSTRCRPSRSVLRESGLWLKAWVAPIAQQRVAQTTLHGTLRLKSPSSQSVISAQRRRPPSKAAAIISQSMDGGGPSGD
jgi:hypothetical protein